MNTDIFNWLSKADCITYQRFIHTDYNIYEPETNKNLVPSRQPVYCHCKIDCKNKSSCSNVRNRVECSKEKCDLKFCSNRESTLDFNFKNLMQLNFIDSKKHFGIQATKAISKGTFLGLVAGKVLSSAETQKAEEEERDNYLFNFCSKKNFKYVLKIELNFIILHNISTSPPQ